MTTARQRVVGGILGLALGDALGAPFEFRRAHDIPSPIPAFELPWMDRPPGSWTDDTAMARNLWTSLIATGGTLDTDDVLRRHLEWFASSPPDIGNQTVAALREHQRGTPDAAKAVFDRRGPEVSAGNGSVMYCAPLGLAYADRADDLLEAAPALSAITHWDERCKTACLAVTLTAAALVRGDDPESAVRAALAARRRSRRRRGTRLPHRRRRHRATDRRSRPGVHALHRGCRAPRGGGGEAVRRRICARSWRSVATRTRTHRWPARCWARSTASTRSRPTGWTAWSRRPRSDRKRRRSPAWSPRRRSPRR